MTQSEAVAEAVSAMSPRSTSVRIDAGSVAPVPYLDPEGGYAAPEAGRAAELAAMTNWPKMNVNHLPTKSYLDATITPTVLKALTEVC